MHEWASDWACDIILATISYMSSSYPLVLNASTIIARQQYCCDGAYIWMICTLMVVSQWSSNDRFISKE